VSLIEGLSGVPGNPIELFVSRGESPQRCKTCGAEKRPSQTMRSWGLSLPDQRRSVDIQERIRVFSVPEDVEGFVCDQCHVTGVAEKRMVIDAFAEILVIHLMRFRRVGDRNVKIDTPVRYPVHLFLSEGDQEVEYVLRGIILHRGDLQGGHYRAILMDDDEHGWMCDDSSVTECEHSQQDSAYVLFYRRGA
jgi:ubiquitin C-terminal hydrolase